MGHRAEQQLLLLQQPVHCIALLRIHEQQQQQQQQRLLHIQISTVGPCLCYWICTPVSGNEEQRREHYKLHVYELDRMDCRDREGSGLFVRVVKLVEVFVQPRSVVHSMMPICEVVLHWKPHNHNSILKATVRPLKVLICTCQMKIAGHWTIAHNQPCCKKS